MNKTQIEWAQNPDGTPGFSWNPITGCLNGCEYCYARKLANTRLKNVYTRRNDNLIPPYQDLQGLTHTPSNHAKLMPFYPRWWEERMLDVPIKNYEPNKHLGIFTCDMSDLFGIGIPEEWTRRVMTKISTGGSWHRFYLLTKQPQNLQKFSPFPDNAWVGVSATDTDSFMKACQYMDDMDNPMHFISFEPLLNWDFEPGCMGLSDFMIDAGIKWVIIGSQTGTEKELLPIHHKTGLAMVRLNNKKWALLPQKEWVSEIIKACDKAGIPVFLKNNLSSALGWSQEPNVLRQEMPNLS